MVRRRGSAVGVVLALALTGCGGGDEPAAEPSAGASTSAEPSPSAAPTPSSYLPVPAGVTLTDQGSALAVGQPATVAWQPRQDLTGVIDVTIDRLETTTIEESFVGWAIPEQTADAAPYFVRATLVNRGDTDLGGRAIPLYAVAGGTTLIEATSFASAFKPCRDGQFPESFPPGATMQACLVYFAPEQGQLSAVSFRPTQEFDPITWTGELLAPEGRRRGGRPSASPSASPSAG